MEQFDNFEGFFKDEFEDFESEPSVESWEKIREQLHPKPKRRILAFWWLPTTALLVTGLTYLLFPQQPHSIVIADKDNIALENDNTKGIVKPNEQNNADGGLIEQRTTANNSEVVISRKSSIGNKAYSNTTQNKPQNNIEKTDVAKSNINTHVNAVTQTENVVPQRDNTSKDITVVTEKQQEIVDIEQTAIELKNTKSIQHIIEALPMLWHNISVPQKTISVQLPTISNNIIAQSTAHITTPVHKQNINKTVWFAKIGATANYRNINPTTDDNQLISDITAPKLSAAKRLGFQAAIGLQVPLYKHLAWRNSLNYQGTMQYLYYHLSEGQGASFTGTSTGSSFQVTAVDYETSYITDKQYFHSVGLQSDLVYLLNKTHSVSFGAGFGKLLTSTPRQNTLYLNAAYIYKMKYFSIEPFVQYHLKNYKAKSGLYDYQPFSFGINIGIK